MFDIEVFRNDPRIFYSFARQILPSTTAFSPTHAFLKLLQDKNKLLKVYTQNIDNLEQLAGIREDKLVQCHGSFATASCMRCKLQVSGEEIREDILNGLVPKCVACEVEREKQSRQKTNGKKKRKRNTDWEDDDDDEDDDDIIEGIMKVIFSQVDSDNSLILLFLENSCRRGLITLFLEHLDLLILGMLGNVIY
jgi:NAD-dependent histone deacetylase SIR2